MAKAQMEAMPIPDPIPDPIPTPIPAPRDPRDLERSHRAWVRYRKLMRWMALASVLTVIVALIFPKAPGPPMPLHRVTPPSLGAGLSVLLGTALMGLVFLSDSGGHDAAASGRSDRR